MGRGKPRTGGRDAGDPAASIAAETAQLRELTRLAHEAAQDARDATRGTERAGVQLAATVRAASTDFQDEIYKFHRREVAEHMRILNASTTRAYDDIVAATEKRFEALHRTLAALLGFKSHEQLVAFVIAQCRMQMRQLIVEALRGADDSLTSRLVMEAILDVTETVTATAPEALPPGVGAPEYMVFEGRGRPYLG